MLEIINASTDLDWNITGLGKRIIDRCKKSDFRRVQDRSIFDRKTGYCTEIRTAWLSKFVDRISCVPHIKRIKIPR
jgi:hypothetical protein